MSKKESQIEAELKKFEQELYFYPYNELTRPGTPKPIKDGSEVRCSHAHCDQQATHYLEVKIHPDIKIPFMLELCPEHTRQIEALHNLEYIEDGEAPDAPAIRDGRGHWKILSCPYCGQSHLHGGADEPGNSGLGHRAAHCGGNYSKINEAGYILVESSARGTTAK
jgi:hypothetical protein